MVLVNNHRDFPVIICVLSLGVRVMFFCFWGVFVLVLPLFLVRFSGAGIISCVVCAFHGVEDAFLMGIFCVELFSRHNCRYGDGSRMSNLGTCLGRSFFVVYNFSILRMIRGGSGAR